MAGSGPPPRGRNARDVAMAAARAFTGHDSGLIKRLRYALTYALTDGRATSANDLDGAELHAVHEALTDIAAGTARYSHDPVGATFTLADGAPVTVAWSDLERGGA